MPNYNHPGVFIEEISTLPPSVAPVSTAIPVFIGYTEWAGTTNPANRPLSKKAVRIRSMFEYESLFGKAAFQNIEVTVEGIAPSEKPISAKIGAHPSPYLLYYQVTMYFLNGGGPCYIISIGAYLTTPAVNIDDYIGSATIPGGLFLAKKVDEITLLLFPDAGGLDIPIYYLLYQNALEQCLKLKDRFTIIDVKITGNSIIDFRNGLNPGPELSSYGAAYYPNIQTSLSYSYKTGSVDFVTPGGAQFDASALVNRNDFKQALRQLINKVPVILPPGGAIAGVYAQVDRNRGVFKAPANVSLNAVSAPEIRITDEDQEDLNIHTSGKSINAIRAFTGKGVLVWGARTLDGNSAEWKYVSVRRFFIFVEESLKKAIEPFVFEPNDTGTWTRIKGLIENFLLLQWRSGALAGSTPAQAFVVKIGLAETMTAQDILEGRLIAEVGLAVVRPAEFIYIKFTHKLQEA